MKNNFDIPVAYLLSLCYSEDSPRATSFVIGEKYEIDGKKYLYDESVYDELIKCKENGTESIRIVRSGNIVNLSGIRNNK